MSFQGPVGPRGTTGPTGVTGQKGLQGPARGPTGGSFYQLGTLPAIVSYTSSPTISLSASTTGTYYFLNSGVTTMTINAYTPSYPTDIGCFWTFQNNSGVDVSVTWNPNGLSGSPSSSSPGGGLVYNGNTTATTFGIKNTSGVTIAYAYDTVGHIQYFVVF
jgi:hypothetical protein